MAAIENERPPCATHAGGSPLSAIGFEQGRGQCSVQSTTRHLDRLSGEEPLQRPLAVPTSFLSTSCSAEQPASRFQVPIAMEGPARGDRGLGNLSGREMQRRQTHPRHCGHDFVPNPHFWHQNCSSARSLVLPFPVVGPTVRPRSAVFCTLHPRFLERSAVPRAPIDRV